MNISLEKLQVERLNRGNPILTAVPDHPWEKEVVFNPGCVFLDDKYKIHEAESTLALTEDVRAKIADLEGVCVMIYRAQGRITPDEDYRHSSLGLALLSPTLDLIYRHPVPIMVPDQNYDDLGVEDPRITEIDGKFVMFYAGYSSTPKSGRQGSGGNSINICIATSDDLFTWEKKGKLKGTLNDVHNKNAMLFPQKLGGVYRIFHRPMEGAGAMAIHTAHADSLLGEWIDDGVLMSAIEFPAFTKSWIGGGAPPLQIDDREYIALYHTGHFKPDGSREYDLGICKIRFDETPKVIERVERFMTPQSAFEVTANESLGVSNVLFVCGSYIYNNYLYFPYAGADSVVLAARIKI